MMLRTLAVISKGEILHMVTAKASLIIDGLPGLVK